MKRQLPPEARAGVGAAFVLLCLVFAVEIADGPQANYIGLMAAAPFLAAAFASWREGVAGGTGAPALSVTFGAIGPTPPQTAAPRAPTALLHLRAGLFPPRTRAAGGAPP